MAGHKPADYPDSVVPVVTQPANSGKVARHAPSLGQFVGGAQAPGAPGIRVPCHPRSNARMVDEEFWDPGNYDHVRLFVSGICGNEKVARERLSAVQLSDLLRALGFDVSPKQVRTMSSEIHSLAKALAASAKVRAVSHTHHPVTTIVEERRDAAN